MKKFLMVVFSAALLVSAAGAQLSTGTITTTSSNCSPASSCVLLVFNTATGGATITIGGTFTGATIQFEALGADGTTWVAIAGSTLDGLTTGATTASAANVYQFNVTATNAIRARASALATGSVLVSIRSSTASPPSFGLGGGGGAVNSVTGAGTVTCTPTTGSVICTGAGGATFSSGSIQFATSSTAARATVFTDIVALFGSCSGVLYLGADGNCHTGGTGTVTNTAGPLVANFIMTGNGVNDSQVDGVATLDGMGNQILTSSQTTGDGTHPGMFSWAPNSTDNTQPLGYFSISGPLVASMTSWGIRFGATVPASAGLCLKSGTITAGNWVPITFATCGGGGGASTINLPVAVAQGAAGCALGGSYQAANAPGCLLVAGTSTTTQRATAQFCATAPCTYTGVGGGASAPYMDYNLTMPSAGIASVTFGFRADSDATNAHTAIFDFQYVCSAPAAVTTGTLNTAQLATGTLDGTITHYQTAVLTGPTITGCAAGNLLQMRVSLDATSTATGNINLINLQVVPQ